MTVAGFDWDEANREQCQQHGVSLAAIESLFQGTVAVFPDPAHSQREERCIAIGKTATGRSVFLAFTLRMRGQDTYIRPMSARSRHRKESAHDEKEIAKAENR